MKFRSRRAGAPQRLTMTAMIDIVFLLLVFFVMTFRIVAMEGDFVVNTAAAAGDDPPLRINFPLRVRLTAQQDGSLDAVYCNNQRLAGFDELRERVEGSVERSDSDLEVVIHCDHQLKYNHLIDAITAVTGDDPAEPIAKISFTTSKSDGDSSAQ